MTFTPPRPLMPPSSTPKSTTGATVIGGLIAVFTLIGLAIAVGGDSEGTIGAPPAPVVTVTVTAKPQAPTRSSAIERVDTQRAQGAATHVDGNGEYVVGRDLRPGTYRTAGNDNALGIPCYWQRSAAAVGGLTDIIAGGSPSGEAVVTVAATDKRFTTHGCQDWERVG